MREQSVNEEIANCATHGIGVMFSAVALVTLVTMANINGNTLQVVSFSIYGSTLILMYLSSTLYHGFASPRIKRIFQLADHAAIY